MDFSPRLRAAIYNRAIARAVYDGEGRTSTGGNLIGGYRRHDGIVTQPAGAMASSRFFEQLNGIFGLGTFLDLGSQGTINRMPFSDSFCRFPLRVHELGREIWLRTFGSGGSHVFAATRSWHE